MTAPRAAAILAGGKGTRLAGVVDDRPKPLAEVAGRPFLEWLLLALRARGVRRAHLLGGHQGARLAAWAEEVGERLGLALSVTVEPRPLGTGGALRLALDALAGDPLLVLNGDSLCPLPLAALAERHRAAGATATLLAVRVPDAGRFGTLALDAGGRVREFREKDPAGGPGLVSGGVYLLARRLVEEIPAGRAVSLEREILPGLAARGELVALPVAGRLLDIGTPDSFREAETLLPELAAEAAGVQVPPVRADQAGG